MNKFIPTIVLFGAFASFTQAFQATVISKPGETDGLNGPWTLGYSFVPNIDLTVTALGSFAPRVGYVRSIGIWDSAGSLLMSAQVNGSEGVVDYMNYTSNILSAVGGGFNLTAGKTYIVGSTAVPGDGNWSLNATFSVDPSITYLQSRFAFGSTLLMPNSSNPIDQYFGGSFQAVPTVSNQPVPEPCTMLIIGLTAGTYLKRRLKP